MKTSFLHEDDERNVLLMPAWKRRDGQEIFYVVHANYAVTREAYIDGVKLGTQYAGELRSVDFEPQLLFVNYLPVEDPVRRL
ncbi:unnamed protein product [Angiostrongylus costaricensis]|uniref:X-Pro aminopeptidase n=1 Tax=Angiostrongylus costaricensis TaxID=334426 RepID=A0A0R3PMU9_ANGCS|nr:unnamed protein product [Angiostrongylus costaricensis]